MEENIHNDHLEEYFRKAFNEASLPESPRGWDVPPDRVWDAIREGAAESPRRSLPWRWIGLAALLLLVVIAFQIYTCTQIHSLNERLDENVALLEELQQQQAAKELPDEGKEVKEEDTTTGKPAKREDVESMNLINQPEAAAPSASSAREQRRSKASPESSQPIDTARALQSPPGTYPELSEKATEIAENSLPPKPIANELKPVPIKDTENLTPFISDVTPLSASQPLEPITSGPELGQSAIRPLSTLPLKPPLLVAAERKLDLSPGALQSKAIKPLKVQSGFYVAAFYAPTLVTKKLKSNRPDFKVLADRLKKQEMADYSFDIGLQLGYRFANGWGVESGGTFSQINVGASQQRQIRYTKVGERPLGNGELVNDYQAMLNTSFGTVNTDVTLNRTSDVAISQNSFINLRFETRHQLEFIRIPLLLTYRAEKGRLMLTPKAGLAWNYLVANELEIHKARSLRNGTRLQQRSRTIRNSFGKLKRSTLDLQLGLGLSFALSGQLHLVAEPSYSRALTPVFEGQYIRTFPQKLGLQAGTQFIF